MARQLILHASTALLHCEQQVECAIGLPTSDVMICERNPSIVSSDAAVECLFVHFSVVEWLAIQVMLNSRNQLRAQQLQKLQGVIALDSNCLFSAIIID